ncbi:hypothetical protein BXZ70DRAFT_728472 [Cristinia sonorae]|uniref:ER transporter 6TM N-terminal domain-containing protein n=1 Tax=Cristinia sonorae TaxID=1940300 RepID=A0A8K0UTY5_9AGAR|nr:hypothetical protein BXZ70DRAFT_728472 [Cristinia sonorae]
MHDHVEKTTSRQESSGSASDIHLDILNANDAKPSFLDKLPPWVSDNLRSPRSWKTFLRCWVATWISFVLMLPDKSANTLGFAGFFAMLTSVIIPAMFPLQFYFFLISTMLIGMLIGWGFGAAAMRAGLAVRNQVVARNTLEKEMAGIAGLSNPDAVFQDDIFKGIFLDTKVSAVYAVFLALGTFFFAMARAYNPRLLIFSVFGTVTLDILCSFGPLFPVSEYMLLNSLMISTGAYAAIGVALIILIFPETMNHAFLVSTSEILGKLKKLVDLQELVLSARPSDLDANSPLIQKVVGSRTEVVLLFQKLTATSKFINLEFSWGKWSGEDVVNLEAPLLGVVSRTAALQSFARIISHPVSRSFDTPNPNEAVDSSATDVASTLGPSEGLTSETFLLHELRSRNRVAEASHSVRMTDVMPTVREATRDLRASTSASITAVQSVLDSINTKRYSRNGDADADKKVEQLADSMHHLRQALADFKETKRLQLVEPFQPLLEATKGYKTGASAPPPLRTLFISFVFGANMVTLAEGVLNMMEFVLATASKRRRNRLWAPNSILAIFKALATRDRRDEQGAGEDEVPDRPEVNEKNATAYKLDPDSRPPTNAIQRFADVLHKIYKWTKSPEALFGIRYALLSVALWIPSVVRSTAHFAYAEKAIWVLIMAQTTMNIYASDQIYNYVLRVAGSVLGALLGMLTWYLGNAHGRGNVYGSAAAVALTSIPVLFFRIFAPLQYLPAAFLLGATWVLILGFSWLDGHIPVYGNVGWGWSVVWRRFVTVMIGCAASFVMMMLPPKSGRKAVRLRNANTITTLSHVYQEITSAWINDGRMFPQTPGGHPSPTFADQIPQFRDRVLGVAAQIQALRIQTMIAKFEGNFRGKWPMDEYVGLVDTQTEMLISLTLLGSALAQLDQNRRVSYLHHTRTVNPSFVADVVSSFSTIAQALRSGEPLSQTFHQNLLDRLFYHGVMHATTSKAIREGPQSLSAQGTEDPTESIMDYEFMFYASAVVAVFQLVEGLNKLRRITATLCGEVPLHGYDEWRNQYDRTHSPPPHVGVIV